MYEKASLCMIYEIDKSCHTTNTKNPVFKICLLGCQSSWTKSHILSVLELFVKPATHATYHHKYQWFYKLLQCVKLPWFKQVYRMSFERKQRSDISLYFEYMYVNRSTYTVHIVWCRVVQSPISANPGLTLNKTYGIIPGLALIGLWATGPWLLWETQPIVYQLNTLLTSLPIISTDVLVNSQHLSPYISCKQVRRILNFTLQNSE